MEINVKILLNSIVILLLSFILLDSQTTEASISDKKYKVLYFMGINECITCSASIRSELVCIQNKHPNIEIKGYLFSDRQIEQEYYLENNEWIFDVIGHDEKVLDSLNVKRNTRLILLDTNSTKMLIYDFQDIKKNSFCTEVDKLIN